MKSSDMPKPSDLLKAQTQADVRAYVTYLLISRLCKQLYEDGTFDRGKIEKLFDQTGSEKLLAPSHHSEFVLLFEGLKKWCLKESEKPPHLN